MKSPLGNFIRERRAAGGFDKRGALVRKIRPEASERQMSRLGAQLYELEERGIARPEFLDEVVAALGIGDDELDPVLDAENRLRLTAYELDLARWNRWADEPIRPYFILVPVPGINCLKKIPDEAIVSLEAAEAWAVKHVQKGGPRGALVWSRRLTVWIDHGGTILKRTESLPGEQNVPYAIIGRRKVVLELKG